MENLKPIEICFLYYMNNIASDKNVAMYWYYDGINPNKEIDKLISLGLLVANIDIKRNISKLTIPVLKELLKSKNLSVSGKKQELIERVLGNIDLTLLESKYNTKTYTLTKQGLQLIEQNYIYILNKNRQWGFSNAEIKKAYQNSTEDMSNIDIIWKMLNNKNMKLIQHGNWNEYANNLRIMAQMYCSTNNYKNALIFYLAIFAIDLSGVSNENIVDSNDLIFVSTAALTSIKECLEKENISQDELSEYITKSIPYRKNLPFYYYNDNSMKKILIDSLDGIEFDYRNYPTDRKPRKNATTYQYREYSDLKEYFKEPSQKTVKTESNTKENKNKQMNIIFKLIKKILKNG